MVKSSTCCKPAAECILRFERLAAFELSNHEEFCDPLIARATDAHGLGMAAPTCLKCRKAQVQCGRTQADAVAWRCDRSGTEGEISHCQGTLWDLRRAGGPAS